VAVRAHAKFSDQWLKLLDGLGGLLALHEDLSGVSRACVRSVLWPTQSANFSLPDSSSGRYSLWSLLGNLLCCSGWYSG
jgi:hypothetical protein